MRWVAAAQADKAGEMLADKAIVYVDRSGSMAGYIKGRTDTVAPFQDLVRTLPAMLGQQAKEAHFVPFGTKIGEVAEDLPSEILSPRAYSCPQGGCDNQESRLDVVLSEIAADKNTPAVILTDLWFDNSAESSTGLTALRAPLKQILASGRAIAVYGIAANFDGTIYGVPGVGAKPFKGTRPLYMIAITTRRGAEQMGEELARSGSRYLAEGISSGAIKRSVFSVDPSALASRGGEEPLSRGNSPDVLVAKFEDTGNVPIQQIEVRSLRAPRDAGGVQYPAWKGPDDKDFLANAVWKGPIKGRVKMWYRGADSCAPESWLEVDNADRLFSETSGAGQLSFALDPAVLADYVDRDGVYLLSSQLERQSVSVPNPDNAWMRSWNLDPLAPSGPIALESGAPLFPTLNLAEFARQMENALAEAAEEKGGAITGFSALVKVSR